MVIQLIEVHILSSKASPSCLREWAGDRISRLKPETNVNSGKTYPVADVQLS